MPSPRLCSASRRSESTGGVFQHYLGHADISSTQVYAGVSPDDLTKLKRNMEARNQQEA